MFDYIAKNAIICIKETDYNIKIINQIKNKSCFIINCDNN